MLLVSVIIPNYNHAKYLTERIESVINQTYENIEVIILDDKSTDDSREIIEQYRKHPKLTHVIYNNENSGSPFKQWKKGIELAKGDFIWIAESDDRSDLDFLRRVMALLNKTKVNLCFTNSFLFNDKSLLNKMFDADNNDEIVMPGSTVLKNWLINKKGVKIGNSSSSVVKREVALKIINSFNFHQYKFAGDKAFWLPVLLNNQVAVINEPLNYYRVHLNNTSRTKYSDIRSVIDNTKENIRLNNILLQEIELDNSEKQKLLNENKRLINQVLNRTKKPVQKVYWKYRLYVLNKNK